MAGPYQVRAPSWAEFCKIRSASPRSPTAILEFWTYLVSLPIPPAAPGFMLRSKIGDPAGGGGPAAIAQGSQIMVGRGKRLDIEAALGRFAATFPQP